MSVPFVAAYSATKFGVEAISDALRVELRPWKIKVSCIEPGSIATPLWERGFEQFDRQVEKMSPQARALYGEYVPRMRKITQRTASMGIPAARVADAVEHALTAARPRTRYLVGRDAFAQSAFRRVPDRSRDAVFGRVMGLDKKS